MGAQHSASLNVDNLALPVVLHSTEQKRSANAGNQQTDSAIKVVACETSGGHVHCPALGILNSQIHCGTWVPDASAAWAA